MTTICLILHYPPTLHSPANSIYFCPIPKTTYILTQILNPNNAYIKEQMEYFFKRSRMVMDSRPHSRMPLYLQRVECAS
jgi:hypothetical protein